MSGEYNHKKYGKGSSSLVKRTTNLQRQDTHYTIAFIIEADAQLYVQEGNRYNKWNFYHFKSSFSFRGVTEGRKCIYHDTDRTIIN